jgi:hypothetical protein
MRRFLRHVGRSLSQHRGEHGSVGLAFDEALFADQERSRTHG